MTPKRHSPTATSVFRLSGPLAADPTAQVLNGMLWALTIWFGGWGIVLLPFHLGDWLWTMQNQILTDAALVSALVLLRRGRFRAASFIFLVSTWFFATHVMVLNGGIRSPAQVLYVTLPISAAWLLGYRAAIWVAGVCMSCTLVLATLELSGVNLPRRIPGTPLGVWAVFGMACLIGAVPVAQILRDLRAALRRSREAEEESARMLERLQTEIEEHKRTEQALKESEARFRIAADTAPVMITVRDGNLAASFFNRVWLNFTGRTLEQELGRGWLENVHPDDWNSYVADLSAASAAHQEYELQFRMRRADGEYRLMLCHGVPRFEVDRTFSGYIASCTDITDLKRRQDEAMAVQKWESLGVLASGIAHDFNNLLGSISAQSEVLMQDLEGSPASESVGKIASVAVRASEIVRQLMVYAGHESATLEQVDLASVIREMLPLMLVSAAKNARLEMHLSDSLPKLRANVTQMRQVLLSLVTNASEALAGMEGVITIRLTETSPEAAFGSHTSMGGQWLRLEVSDTGCGMTDQVRAGIFDPFFTTKGAGRGLGLAAVQGIVRSHGGNISVVSAPGRGSRFDILLPCAQTENLHAGTDRSFPNRAGFNGTVLIVEDEDMLRRAVTKLLRANGVRVLESADGRAAVELFRAHAAEIDVALLDVTLPGWSGREVFKELRKIKPSVKIIITSAYGRERALADINAEPCQAYIRKPYRCKELLELIQKTCRTDVVRASSEAPQSFAD